MELFMSIKLLFHLKFLIFLLLLLLSGAKNSKITRCREKERQALAMFKEGLTDKSGLLSSWQTRDCCEWKGVRCSNLTGHVIALHLSSGDQEYSLRGKVSPSLLELEYLTYLDLSRFDGSRIPEFISSLKRLKYLDLSRGTFAGEIPVQLGNLSNLQYLDLSNSFGRLSVKNLDWLSDLSSMRYLNLSSVNLNMAHDWTKSIDRLPFLQELILSGCELPGITLTKFSPSSFNFSRSIISVLDLSDNNFGIELSRFHWLLNHSTTLKKIALPSNKFSGGIPHDFGKMQSLEYLDVSRSTLEGELTNSIGNISTLKLLDLSFNKFNGTIPPSILKLPKLETLVIRGNRFQGELPEFLPLSPLMKLDLSLNNLSGNLPPSMGNLTELKVMDFSSNGFTGPVTDVHLHNLSKLTQLQLSHNSLNLELNSDWVPPFNLTSLSLGNCEIGPHFPSWLKTQPHLVEMNLFGCGIDDVLPNWFSHNFPQLFYLNLSNNQIHGNLSYSLSGFGSLGIIDLSSNKFQSPITSICNFSTYYPTLYLDLSNNLFSGTVPNCLMQSRELGYLNLRNNKFSGKLPSSIGLLTKVEILLLRNNSLYGELPMSLQLCKQLAVIDVGHNKFRGEIPRWLGTNLQYLVILGLRSNQFKGTIPSTLCHLRNLQILDLSNNNIYGKLPNCLGNLISLGSKKSRFVIRSTSIPSIDRVFVQPQENAWLVWKGIEREYSNSLGSVKSIDLSNNRLSGEIPSEIAYLEGLHALNISGNNLHGNIPQEIGRLQQLESLDLSRNQLSGVIPLSLSKLHFIGFLNLSINNLSGRIPLSTQLQSFSTSSYLGNPGLCGLPLPKLCLEDQRNSATRSNRNPHEVEEDEEEWFKSSSFYAATGIGFAVGLWATLGSLIVSRSWRVTYFRLVSNIQDWLYVSIVVKMAKLKRLLKN